MPRELKPKTVSYNPHPLKEHRLQACDNGWPQTIVRQKKGGKGWPRKPYDRAAIETDKEWNNPWYDGTAILVRGTIAFYDLDVTIPAIGDEIIADLYDQDPDAYDGAILRDSGGYTLGIIWRCEVPFKGGHTHSYTAYPEHIAALEAAFAMPETSEEEDEAKTEELRRVYDLLDPQKVEIYGPLTRGRLVQVEGVHTEATADKPARLYNCQDNRAPWNTPLSDVSLMPRAYDKEGEHLKLLNRAEAVLEKRLTRIPEKKQPEGSVFYDLTTDMKFYPKNGEPGTIEELTSGLGWGGGSGIVGCAPWTRASRSHANCKLYVTVNGRVALVDWTHDGALHYLISDAPPEPVQLTAETREAIESVAAAPAPPDSDSLDSIKRGDERETYENAANWLLRNVAYYTQAFNGRGGAVSIHPEGEFRTPVTIAALRGRMLSYSYIETGPLGGQHRQHPVDAWATSADQQCVDGIRMRPDMQRPKYREDGLVYLNRYFPVVHPTSGGSTAVFDRFLVRLVPEPRERAWVVNWLASKVQHPEWRMIALAMVARDMGSGRGLLAETLQYLLGARFVAPLPYAKLSGGSGSRFNAEVVDKLLVYINESRDADDRKFAHKNAAREALKDFLEPNHRLPFRVEPKGLDAYATQASISTIIFSNNIDGLPIGEGDRRAAVVLNGMQMSVAEREEYQAWLLVPENIGALYRELAGHRVEQNKSLFDAYMAPEFHGRDLMIDASKTALDHAWETAVERIAEGSELYTMRQIVALTARLAGRLNSSDFDELVKKHTIVNGHRIGTKNGTNWLVRYGEGEDNRERVYALSEGARRRWSSAIPSDIKRQLDLTQEVVTQPLRRFSNVVQLIKTTPESK